MSAECASNEDLQFENAKVGEKMWVGDQQNPGPRALVRMWKITASAGAPEGWGCCTPSWPRSTQRHTGQGVWQGGHTLCSIVLEIAGCVALALGIRECVNPGHGLDNQIIRCYRSLDSTGCPGGHAEQ